MERRKGISESRYRSLPEDVREEFRQREKLEEAANREREAALRKKSIQGAVAGGILALVLGLLVGEPTIPYLVVLVACEAAAAYLVVRKQFAHTIAMLVYGIPPAPVTLIFVFVGLLGVNVAHMICSWVIYAVFANLLAIWAGEKERGDLRYEPPGEDDSEVPELGRPDVRDTSRD